MVRATIRGTGATDIYIKGVLTIPAQSKFIIYFNQAIPSTLKIAWFVLN